MSFYCLELIIWTMIRMVVPEAIDTHELPKLSALTRNGLESTTLNLPATPTKLLLPTPAQRPQTLPYSQGATDILAELLVCMASSKPGK